MGSVAAAERPLWHGRLLPARATAAHAPELNAAGRRRLWSWPDADRHDGHEFARSGNWKDPAANLLYGAGVLVQARAALDRALSLSGVLLWQASLAAYICGAGNAMRAIQAGRDADFFTTGRDYGRDTLNRAGWFLLKGWI